MATGTTEVKIRPLKGVVVSDAMHKSRTLKIERLIKHKEYGKYIKQATKLIFHDEDNSSKVGDEVLVQPCRPHSKRKNFKLVQILQRAKS